MHMDNYDRFFITSRCFNCEAILSQWNSYDLYNRKFDFFEGETLKNETDRFGQKVQIHENNQIILFARCETVIDEIMEEFVTQLESHCGTMNIAKLILDGKKIIGLKNISNHQQLKQLIDEKLIF